MIWARSLISFFVLTLLQGCNSLEVPGFAERRAVDLVDPESAHLCFAYEGERPADFEAMIREENDPESSFTPGESCGESALAAVCRYQVKSENSMGPAHRRMLGEWVEIEYYPKSGVSLEDGLRVAGFVCRLYGGKMQLR